MFNRAFNVVALLGLLSQLTSVNAVAGVTTFNDVCILHYLLENNILNGKCCILV